MISLKKYFKACNKDKQWNTLRKKEHEFINESIESKNFKFY
jgi:hypothetical protein